MKIWIKTFKYQTNANSITRYKVCIGPRLNTTVLQSDEKSTLNQATKLAESIRSKLRLDCDIIIQNPEFLEDIKS